MALHVAAVPGLTCDRLGEGRRGYYQNITIKILYPILTGSPTRCPAHLRTQVLLLLAHLLQLVLECGTHISQAGPWSLAAAITLPRGHSCGRRVSRHGLHEEHMPQS